MRSVVLAEEVVNHLFLPHWFWPLLALGIAIILGVITLSYRGVAHRHDETESMEPGIDQQEAEAAKLVHEAAAEETKP